MVDRKREQKPAPLFGEKLILILLGTRGMQRDQSNDPWTSDTMFDRPKSSQLESERRRGPKMGASRSNGHLAVNFLRVLDPPFVRRISEATLVINGKEGILVLGKNHHQNRFY